MTDELLVGRYQAPHGVVVVVVAARAAVRIIAAAATGVYC